MIYYLSCTGNTRWAAERLGETTNERTLSIFEAVGGECRCHLRDGERLGFCLPVHGWRVQPIVREFLEHLIIYTPEGVKPQQVYTYFLLTCGDSCGEYGDELETLLTEKGLRVDSCCSLTMPEAYVNLPGFDVDKPLREAEKKAAAHGTLSRFADIITDHRSVRLEIERGATPRLYSRVLGRAFCRWLVTDRHFHVDEAKCKGCGLCVKQCPVGNMTMNEGHPAWQHNGRCLTCMACYHHCPEHAIRWGRFTDGKGQYFFTHNRRTV